MHLDRAESIGQSQIFKEFVVLSHKSLIKYLHYFTMHVQNININLSNMTKQKVKNLYIYFKCLLCYSQKEKIFIENPIKALTKRLKEVLNVIGTDVTDVGTNLQIFDNTHNIQNEKYQKNDQQIITKLLNQAGFKINQNQNICLGCCPCFQESKPLPKTDQFYSILYFNSFSKIFQDKLKKKMCALLNCQGGYLLIFSSYKNNEIKGLNFPQFQINQIEKQIKYIAKAFIFPQQFSMRIQQVKTSPSNKVVLRIRLEPAGGNVLYFIKKEIKNYPTAFFCYFLKPESIGSNNDIYILRNTSTMYNLLIQHKIITQKASSIKIIHRKGCIERNNALYEVIKMINNKSSPLHKIQLIKHISQDPIIKYRNQSLVILPSKADDQYIDRVKRQLQLNKMNQFVFTKPYQLCRSNSIKSIWVVSHQYEINDFMNIFQNIMTIKNKIPTMLTCTKYITIKKKQQHLLKQYIKTFQEYFSTYPEIYKRQIDEPFQNNKNLYDFYMKFKTYQESIFTFMYLDDARMDPRISKEMQFLEKKVGSIPVKYQQIIMK